jgi:hypothetical protein
MFGSYSYLLVVGIKFVLHQFMHAKEIPRNIMATNIILLWFQIPNGACYSLPVRCADSDTQVDNVGIGCGSGFLMFNELHKKVFSCKSSSNNIKSFKDISRIPNL